MIQTLEENMRNNLKVAKAAVEENPEAYEYLSDTLKQHPVILLALLPKVEEEAF